MDRRQTTRLLKVSQTERWQNRWRKGIVQKRELENQTFWKYRSSSYWDDAVTSVAHELYDFLCLHRSIGSVDVVCTEALLSCGSLTPSLPVCIHTGNVFRNKSDTNLLLILVLLKRKHNKCFIPLQFVDGGQKKRWLEYGMQLVLLYLLHMWCGLGSGHNATWNPYISSVFCLLHKPYKKAYYSCWFPIDNHCFWDWLKSISVLLRKIVEDGKGLSNQMRKINKIPERRMFIKRF